MKEYTYLGSKIEERGRCIEEVKQRIGKTKTAFWKCKDFLRRDITIELKKRLLNCYVKSVVAYGSEAWTYTKEIKNRLNALQLWCYRRMLRIKYTDHVTNRRVKEYMRTEKIWADDLAKSKLRFAGHILRGSSGKLAQIVVEGFIDGKRDIGRQRRTWGDDIKEWTKSENLRTAKRISEDRDCWKIMVHNLQT